MTKAVVGIAALLVSIGCHASKPMARPVPSPPAPASGPVLPPATGNVPLGASGTIDENRVYAVEGTSLRFMMKNRMPPTPVGAGIIFSGSVIVCDGASACAQLVLSGPFGPMARVARLQVSAGIG